jgi:hypothetical protein
VPPAELPYPLLPLGERRPQRPVLLGERLHRALKLAALLLGGEQLFLEGLRGDDAHVWRRSGMNARERERV